MKRITQSLLGLFGIIVVFMACSKSDDTPPNTPAIILSADINNTPWSTSTFGGAILQYDTANHSQKLIFGGGYILSGADTNYQGLTVTIDSFTGLGTYTVKKIGPTQAWYLHAAKQFQASSGSVTVTSYSTKQVSGSFYYKTDSVNVTSGIFNLHVQ